MKIKNILILLLIASAVFIFIAIYFGIHPSDGKIFNTDIKYEAYIKCRKGSTMISYYKVPANISKDQCFRYAELGNLDRVCSNCGNGVCEEWENICTCFKDCY